MYDLICSDSLLYLKQQPDSSVDLFITSPPYNLGIEYGTYSDNLPRQEYLDWMGSIFEEIQRTLKDNGSLFLNVGGSSKDPWVGMDVAFQARRVLTLQNHFIWVKSISIGDESFGQYKPINSKRFVNHCFEHVLHFTKTGNVEIDRVSIGVPYKDKSNLTRWRTAESDKRCRGDCWFVPYQTIQSSAEKGNHPAIFPEQLVEYCLGIAGASSNTLVIDPFCGIGTTVAVCQRFGIPSVGVDIDPGYINYAKKRLGEV